MSKEDQFKQEMAALLKKYDAVIATEMTIDGDEAVIEIMFDANNLDVKSKFEYWGYLDKNMKCKIN